MVHTPIKREGERERALATPQGPTGVRDVFADRLFGTQNEVPAGLNQKIDCRSFRCLSLPLYPVRTLFTSLSLKLDGCSCEARGEARVPEPLESVLTYSSVRCRGTTCPPRRATAGQSLGGSPQASGLHAEVVSCPAFRGVLTLLRVPFARGFCLNVRAMRLPTRWPNVSLVHTTVPRREIEIFVQVHW